MKNSIKRAFCKFGLMLFLVMLGITGKAQTVTGGQYSLSIGTATATANTIDVPLVVSVVNPSAGMRFTGFQTSINFNTAIVNGGTITGTFVPSAIQFNTVGNLFWNGAGNVRITLTSLSNTGSSGVNIAQGSSINIGTIRISNTANWSTANANLWLQTVNATNPTRLQSIVQGVPFGVTSGAATSYTISQPASPVGLILGHTQAAPYSLQVGQICATSGSAVVTNPSCFGATGSAVVSLSPLPSPALSSVSYTVDGGSTQTASVIGGNSFSVSGLSSGDHVIAVSVAGCSTVSVSTTVNVPTQLVASSSAGSIACNGGSTTVTVSATGGTAPYTGTGTFTVNAGSYSYTVTDANGCSATTTGSVSQPAQLTNATTATACDSYFWSVTGQTYTSSGTYTGTSTNGNGCSVNETLNLTINHSSTTSETATACDSYTWHGTTYTTSGDYTYTSTNASGCPNVATLHLTINNSSTTSETATACNTYTWHGTAYTTSGDYTYTSTNASGCPNVATLHLTINNSTTSSQTITACDVYRWNGTAYHTSGTYTYTSTNASGCPNVATLYLTINHSTSTEETQVACDSYTWHGTTYTASGDYTYTTTNASGCDNVATLHLTINHSSTTDETQVACNSYTWNGTTYTASGTYTYTSTNASGCSNVATLHLTINTNSTTEETASACGSYTWHGTTYNASGDYTYTSTNGSGCDNVATLHLTINSNTITSQPTNPTICKLLGATATATVGVSGASSTTTYQWYSQASTSSTVWTSLVNNANYSGVNGPTLTITRTTTTIPPAGTKYRVVVSGTCGTDTSSTVVLQDQTVLSKATTISVVGTLTPALTVCQGSSVNLKLALGSIGNIQWQSSTDNSNWTNVGSVIPQSALSASNPALSFTSDALAQTTWFRVVASNGACISVNSTAIKITVSTPPTPGTISGGNVTVCAPLASGLDLSGNPATFSNSTTLTLNGTSSGATILWQKSTNYVNATNAAPVWASAVNTTGSLTVTNLSADTWYRAKVTNGACVAYSEVVKISVSKSAKAGTIASAATVCYGGDILFTSAAYTGTSLQWEVSTTSATTGFVVVPNQTGLTYLMTNVAFAPLSKFYVRTTVTSGSCTLARSAVKAITVNPLSVGGTVSGGGTVCLSGGGTLKLTGNTGTIQWKYSTDGQNYVNVPVGAATAPTFATTSATGTGSSYVVTGVTGTTYFKALVTSGACSSDYSTVAQFVVGSQAVGGTATPSSSSVCSGTGATITLSGNVGASIVWQKSTNFTAANPTWSAVTGAVSPMLSTGNLTASTAYRAVSSIGSCVAAANSNVVIITVTNCNAKEAPVATNETVVPFGVVAYPNPSSENFNFTLTTSSEEKVGIMVYDMTGKLIDQREVTPSEVSELQVGDRYPSGVYNVIVTQGDNAKTLRVIKR